jgi:antitoxin PrlF
MHMKIEATSTLTDRYQTTVPDVVRKVLGLGRRDKLRYILLDDGSVVLRRDEDADPVVAAFLEFMETEMATHPERLQTLPAELRARIEALIVDVDLDQPLDPADE